MYPSRKMTVCNARRLLHLATAIIVGAALVRALGADAHGLGFHAPESLFAGRLEPPPASAEAALIATADITPTLYFPATFRERRLVASPQDQLGGEISAICQHDRFVYLGVGPRVLVIDVSEPHDPRVIGRTPPFDDLVSQVACRGAHLVVANGRAGLRIIDVSNPATPHEVAQAILTAPARRVTIAGERAFVIVAGSANSGLQVLDVAAPTNPRKLGYLPIPAVSINALAVSGDYAFVAAGETGVWIIDVSNPSRPGEVLRLRPPIFPTDLAVAAPYLYVIDAFESSAGLTIIDIGDPATPHEVAHVPIPLVSFGVAIADNHAYVANQATDEVFVINVTDPTQPVSVASIGAAGHIAAADGYLYASRRGLTIVDVSTPRQPVETSFLLIMGSVCSVDVAGSYAYVGEDTANGGGIWLVDIGTPNNLRATGYLTTPERVAALVATGPLLYAAHRGLSVIDVTIPEAPRVVGHYESHEKSTDLSVGKGIAAVSYRSRVDLVDITVPSDPRKLADIDQGGPIAIQDGYLLVGAPGEGLTVVDLGDVSQPKVVWQGPFDDVPQSPTDVAVIDAIAYLTGFWKSLRVVDLADPAAPQQIASLARSSRWPLTYGIAVADDLAILAHGASGIRLLDVADVRQPRVAGFFDTAGEARCLAAANEMLYVGDGRGGLIVLTIEEL